MHRSYFPLYTRALNASVKGNRALLLLLPTEIVDRVKVQVLAVSCSSDAVYISLTVPILGGSGMFASIAVHHVHAPPPPDTQA